MDAGLAKKFEHLDFTNAPKPVDFRYASFSFEDGTAYFHGMLAWLRNQNQSLSTPDFIDLLSYHNNISYKDLVLSGAHLQFFKMFTENANVSDADSSGGDVFRIINNWILGWCEEGFKNTLVLLMDNPTRSTLNPTKIAVWRNTSRYDIFEKRVAVKVRTWIRSSFSGRSDEEYEALAVSLDKLLNSTDGYDVRLYSSKEFGGWKESYSSSKIESCMSTHMRKPVATEHTFTCYCTEYHGLPDNGLSLAVLYQNDVPVARAITFTDEQGEKGFVKVYGDDRLGCWLHDNGYAKMDGYPEGTILYTTQNLLKPYVDGDVCEADLEYNTRTDTYFWSLVKEDGAYVLNTTEAYAEQKDKGVECACCGSHFEEDEIMTVTSVLNSREYDVCDDCYHTNTWDVYIDADGSSETMFFHDGYDPDTNEGFVRYGDEYYLEEAFPECECCDERFHDDELIRVVSAVDDMVYAVCNECYEEHTWYVHASGSTVKMFFHDGCDPDTNEDFVSYDGEFYLKSALSEYGLVIVDGKVCELPLAPADVA